MYAAPGLQTNHIVHCWDGQSAEIANKKFHTPAEMPKTRVSFPESTYSKLYPVINGHIRWKSFGWMEASQSCQLRQRTQCSGPAYATQSTWSKANMNASTRFNLSPNFYVSVDSSVYLSIFGHCLYLIHACVPGLSRLSSGHVSQREEDLLGKYLFLGHWKCRVCLRFTNKISKHIENIFKFRLQHFGYVAAWPTFIS